MWVTGLSEKSIGHLTMRQIQIEMRKSVTALRETQVDARQMRELWLKETAMKNTMANGDVHAQKVLKRMLRKIHTQSMNSKLSKVTHGEQVGLDYIEIPKGEWFYS